MSVSTQNALLCLPKSKVQQGQERLRAISASRARDVNQLRGLLNSAALNSYEALAKSRSQILECVLREEWRQCGEEEALVACNKPPTKRPLSHREKFLASLSAAKPPVRPSTVRHNKRPPMAGRKMRPLHSARSSRIKTKEEPSPDLMSLFQRRDESTQIGSVEWRDMLSDLHQDLCLQTSYCAEGITHSRRIFFGVVEECKEVLGIDLPQGALTAAAMLLDHKAPVTHGAAAQPRNNGGHVAHEGSLYSMGNDSCTQSSASGSSQGYTDDDFNDESEHSPASTSQGNAEGGTAVGCNSSTASSASPKSPQNTLVQRRRTRNLRRSFTMSGVDLLTRPAESHTVEDEEEYKWRLVRQVFEYCGARYASTGVGVRLLKYVWAVVSDAVQMERKKSVGITDAKLLAKLGITDPSAGEVPPIFIPAMAERALHNWAVDRLRKFVRKRLAVKRALALSAQKNALSKELARMEQKVKGWKMRKAVQHELLLKDRLKFFDEDATRDWNRWKGCIVLQRAMRCRRARVLFKRRLRCIKLIQTQVRVFLCKVMAKRALTLARIRREQELQTRWRGGREKMLKVCASEREILKRMLAVEQQTARLKVEAASCEEQWIKRQKTVIEEGRRQLLGKKLPRAWVPQHGGVTGERYYLNTITGEISAIHPRMRDVRASVDARLTKERLATEANYAGIHAQLDQLHGEEQSLTDRAAELVEQEAVPAFDSFFSFHA